jgi:putative protease
MEVLAPAGDRASLEAAVQAGADAVYFGLQGFNARARAANFDAAALSDTMHYLHIHGRRGYVTLNTLVFDDELPSLEAAVRACAQAGADAVIVQDVGVARLVRAVAPSLPIHASTQMTCTDAGAVELARELGASRVILARELTIDQVAAIRAATDVEVEVFVHGALCISYSGQCLTSEAIGGRSANRGACAQACRLPYELVVDGKLRPVEDRAYLLSPQDLEASALVPRLKELGVSSIKIEGRLKGPAYVSTVTQLYRRAVDGVLDDQLRTRALQTYSRGSGPGWLGGIDHQRLVEGRGCDHRGIQVGVCRGVEGGWLHVDGKPLQRGDGIVVEGGWGGEGELGGRVWDVRGPLVWLGPDVSVRADLAGRRVFKNSDPHLPAAPPVEKRPLDLRVEGRIGERPRFWARAGGVEAEVVGEAPLAAAHSAPVGEAVLRDKLGRLGDTPFALQRLELDWPEGAMVPLSSLNRARRALVEKLLQSADRRHATTGVSWRDLLAAVRIPPATPPPPGLFVLCRNLAQAEAAVAAGADGVYIDFLELTGCGEAVRALRGRTVVGVAPPRIRKPGEDKIDRYLQSLQPDAVLVRGLGALGESGGMRIGDFSLNVTNRLAAAEVLSRGLAAFTPSFDLDATQLVALLDGDLAPFAEVVVHHPMPLFHMEHCVIAALLSNGADYRSCGRPCDRHQVSLRDRQGMDHPVEADVGCRNTVFHAAAQSAADLVPKLASRAGGEARRCREPVASGLPIQVPHVRRFRIELVRESADDVRRLVTTYRALIAGRMRPAEVWRSLKVEGGYGVVRGSLRVVQ